MLIAEIKKSTFPNAKKVMIKIGVSIAAAVLIFAGYDYMLSKEPVAIVIDAETGKPVKGAIALAQWFSSGGGTLFEGGVENLVKAAEAYSDKDGKIYIKRHLFSGMPRLTVYKPGYVLWDSRWLCPTHEKRKDFNENHRTVKLLNFDTETSTWVEKYSKLGFGARPHIMQFSFFNSCYDAQGIWEIYHNNEIKFQDIFDKYELPFVKQEDSETQKKINR